jgi:hypothetical protein
VAVETLHHGFEFFIGNNTIAVQVNLTLHTHWKKKKKKKTVSEERAGQQQREKKQERKKQASNQTKMMKIKKMKINMKKKVLQ